MKNLFRMLTFVAAMAIPLAGAQPLPQIETFLDVQYVTGGVSIEEEQALAELAKDFTLKVVLALKCGDYLNNVDVLILDEDEKIVLETVTNGPILYANLKPGKYLVQASALGEHFEKKVRVRAGRQSEVIFYWPDAPKSCEEWNSEYQNKQGLEIQFARNHRVSSYPTNSGASTWQPEK